MRRLLALATLSCAAVVTVVLVLGASAEGSSTARFDVIFDDARGLIGGQLVKVAGATAGTIVNVSVTPDFKARIEATIDSKFFPFHQDATCIIRPQGLIAENYVDCDPGSASSPVLEPTAGHPPTVPVTHTTEPVSLLDLFNIFNLPTRQRLMVIIDELGIGTAARGQDFNDVLRRANPALALARQAIGILSRQKAQLATLVDATSTVASEAARHSGSLQAFLNRAANVSSITAAHRDSLSRSIKRLPGLLAAAQPALQQLDIVAVSGTPLVQQIHAAVPALNRVATDLDPFVAAAKPALVVLGRTLTRAVPELHAVTPVVRTLRGYTARSSASTKLMGKLFVNLQQHGFIENFLSGFYYIAALTARFDSTSHFAPTYLIFPPGNCVLYATAPTAGCSANFGSQPAYVPSRTLASRAQGAGATPAPASHAAPGRAGTALASAPTSQAAQSTLANLLRGTTHVTSQTLQALTTLLSGGKPPSGQSLQNLVAYLLR